MHQKLAYILGLLLGEAVQDVSESAIDPGNLCLETLSDNPAAEQIRKRRLYSSLFMLLKQKPRLSAKAIRQTARSAAKVFACLARGNVRSDVCTSDSDHFLDIPWIYGSLS